MIIPQYTNKGCDKCTTKETDDSRTIPGVLIATIFQSKQQLDGSRCKDRKADEIKLFMEGSESQQGFRLGRLSRDGDEIERYRDETTNGKVNVEA